MEEFTPEEKKTDESAPVSASESNDKTTSAGASNKRSGWHEVGRLALTAALVLGLVAIVQAFLVKPYRIPSSSMKNTLQINDRVIVNRLGNSWHTPRLGEIIVFYAPQSASSQTCGAPGEGALRPRPCSRPAAPPGGEAYIKRVVAGPGDRVAIRAGHLRRNGQMINDKEFALPCLRGECNYPQEVVIPPGHYFVMGDNRGESNDSRFWGAVPREAIIGQAVAVYWPPNRLRSLR